MSFYKKKKNPKGSIKKQKQKAHAKSRAARRFGLGLNKEALTFIYEQLRLNLTIPIEKQTYKTLHLVWLLNGKIAIAVYDTRRHVLVTFFKPDKYQEHFIEKMKPFEEIQRRIARKGPED